MASFSRKLAARLPSSSSSFISHRLLPSIFHDSEDFVQRLGHTSSGAVENEKSCYIDMSKWRAIDAQSAGVTRSSIAPSAWDVLHKLQKKGYEAYLVGGCVRDLLLKKVPKDFDVITTADLKQIKKLFSRCIIVGKRFPICQVHIQGSIIEVSSFLKGDSCTEKEETIGLSLVPYGCSIEDFVRWENSMHRDFTVNCFFYDPFVNKIYDHANGLHDLHAKKVNTVVDAYLSFTKDCARILRGVRIAARLGLTISKETASAIRDLFPSIATLSKVRLNMELNYMLSYGAAGSSFQLLQEFKLLGILLPIQEAYLAHQMKLAPAGSANMLMCLLVNMDKLLSSDRPCHCSLWTGLLAFHLALIKQPQEALVVWAFCFALYFGDGKKAVELARSKAESGITYVPEILESRKMTDEKLSNKVCAFASLVKCSVDALSNEDSLREAMEKYPDSCCSGLAIVHVRMGKHVSGLFDVFQNGIEGVQEKRDNFEVNYKLLGIGDEGEVRFVLGRIIRETMDSATFEVPKIQDGFLNKQDARIPEVVHHKEHFSSTKKHRPMLSSLFHVT